MSNWIASLLSRFDRPPFKIGDVVRFEPDARALGWTQDMHGLYPGYVGRVTKLSHSGPFSWGVYVDDKPIDFLAGYFRLVNSGESGDPPLP
jgi:hypothetical protein